MNSVAPPDTTIYDEILAAIRKDPEAVIREKRLDQIMAIKLQIPDIILANQKNRRYHYELYETAKGEIDKRRAEITLAVKDEVDPISGKPAFRNKEHRDVEIMQRLEQDAVFRRWESKRRQMYAGAKQLEDEIAYYERLDQSFIEILAMMTAQIEFETRFSISYQDQAAKVRTAARAKARSKNIAQPSPDALTAAGN
jgi:hypothetical protein